MTEFMYDKSTNLREEVKGILFQKGYSHIFNVEDYRVFKKQSKKAFNKAQTIANLFIEYLGNDCDFSEYLF